MVYLSFSLLLVWNTGVSSLQNLPCKPFATEFKYFACIVLVRSFSGHSISEVWRMTDCDTYFLVVCKVG